jgi:hypothetical protein
MVFGVFDRWNGTGIQFSDVFTPLKPVFPFSNYRLIEGRG